MHLPYKHGGFTERKLNILGSIKVSFEAALSRPRRFGKSLLIDTMEELFSGSRELFKGLWIERNWNWEQRHPVIHISFSNIGVNTLGLTEAIHNALNTSAGRLGVVLTAKSYDQQFKELIEKAVFRNYWFATGSPSFLVRGIRVKGEFDFENVSSSENQLGSFDPANMLTIPLLFQTGYLTIKGYNPTTRTYQLGYPNQEVRDSPLDNLLSAYRSVYPADSTEENYKG